MFCSKHYGRVAAGGAAVKNKQPDFRNVTASSRFPCWKSGSVFFGMMKSPELPSLTDQLLRPAGDSTGCSLRWSETLFHGQGFIM